MNQSYFYFHHHRCRHPEYRPLWKVLKIVSLVILIPILIPVGLILFSIFLGLLGMGVGLLSFFPMAVDFMMATPTAIASLIICILLLIGLPVVFLILSIRQRARTPRYMDPIINWTLIGLWIATLVASLLLVLRIADTSGGMKTTLLNMGQAKDLVDAKTEMRPMEAFRCIDISGGIEVDVENAPNCEVKVESMDMSAVETYVVNETLYISIPDMRYLKAKVEVGVPQLRAIKGNGACDVEIDDMVTDSLEVDFNGVSSVELEAHVAYLVLRQNGAGHMKVEGSAQQASFYTNGACRVDAGKLMVGQAHVNAAGSSTLVLHAQQEMWAQAAGTSRVRYKGHPEVKEKLEIGTATIRRD